MILACRSVKPLDIQQLLFAKGNLFFVLVNPKFEAPTAQMRAVLPQVVPMAAAINNCAMGASLVSCLCSMHILLVLLFSFGILKKQVPWMPPVEG